MDIGQFTTAESARFVANNAKADDWMRARYQSIDVTFELPEQADLAKLAG